MLRAMCKVLDKDWDTVYNEGLHYTGIQVIEEGRFKGRIELIQTYPSPLLGHSVEKVVIKSEDIPTNDIDTLRELLSEKCLEYLTNNDIEFVLERLKKKGCGIERVLEKLERKPTSRLKTVVL